MGLCRLFFVCGPKRLSLIIFFNVRKQNTQKIIKVPLRRLTLVDVMNVGLSLSTPDISIKFSLKLRVLDFFTTKTLKIIQVLS